MKKNLGRGLASLMGSFDDEIVHDHTSKEEVKSDHIYSLPINKLHPNLNQPRKNFDESTLKELAESIKNSGVISPIIVKKMDGKDGYEIIAGERRFRAAVYAKKDKIPAIIKEIEDKSAFEISIIENIQRQDLNIVEEAKSYKELMRKYKYNHNDIAATVGKSRSHVTNIMRLLSLPDSLLTLLIEGKLTMGHARALIGTGKAEELSALIVKKGLSVRDAERLIREEVPAKSEKQEKKVAKKSNSRGDIKAIEDLLSKKLRTEVLIHSKTKTKGAISVNYDSLEQLDKILQLLGNLD
jgi:ParB family transcriptional regulator, chromosome partitioning protein